MHNSCGRYSSRLNPRVRCASCARETTASAQPPKARDAHGDSAKITDAAGLASPSALSGAIAPPAASTSRPRSASCVHSVSSRRSFRRSRDRLERYARTKSSAGRALRAKKKAKSVASSASESAAVRTPAPHASSSRSRRSTTGGGAVPETHADRSAASPKCFPSKPPFSVSVATAAKDRDTTPGSLSDIEANAATTSWSAPVPPRYSPARSHTRRSSATSPANRSNAARRE